MKVKKVIGRSLLVLLCIVVVIAIIGIAQFHHRSNPKNLKQYETNNPFITGETAISAHRSGAGEFPEETLAAFRGCAENPDVQVDYFEFDLHMTADDVLVLSHDSTLDRVSDAVTVFGAENVLVRDKTLAELKDLNIAAQFVNDAGETPYTDLHGDAVPDELRSQQNLYRLVQPNEWYVVFTTKASTWKIGIGETCALYFRSYEDITYNATVRQLSGTGDELVVILEMSEDVSPLLNARKLTAVIGGRVEGMMVPLSALKTEGSQQGVYLMESNTFVPVRVVGQDSKHALIMPLEDGALTSGTRIRK